MPHFEPTASGQSKQVNIAGGNFAPITVQDARVLPSALRQLPPVVGDFTGRDTELEQLRGLLVRRRYEASGALVVNLYGPPGVGKSALATRFANLVADRFKGALYVDAGAAGAHLDGTEILAHFVNTLSSVPVYGRYSELRARYLSMLSELDCVIVLDNVRSPNQVKPLIPNSGEALVIVTSRVPLATVDGVVLRPVAALSGEESMELLARVSGRPVTDDRESCSRIVELCGRLPLALRIVGAAARKHAYLRWGKLVERLTDERTRLAALAEGDLDVRSSFALSYVELSDRARHAFRLSSLSPLQEFTVADLACLLTEPTTEAAAALDELVDAQLVMTDDGEHFRCHDLIRLYARARCEEEEDAAAAQDAGARLIASIAEEFLTGYRRTLSARPWRFSEWIYGWTAGGPEIDGDKAYARQSLDSPTAKSGVDWREMADRSPRALVIGGPGSGKTTLAERICIETARGDGGDIQLAIAVPLRQYREGISLHELIVASLVNRFGARMSIPILRHVLADQRAIVVFDSIDELSQARRDRCVAAIEEFCAAHPDTFVVTTSRPDERLERTGIAGFVTYRLRGLSPQQAMALAQAWFGESGDYMYDGFVAGLESSRFGESVLRNPLLLTWAAALYRESGGRRPVDEVGLHEAVFEMTVGHRDASRRITRAATVTASDFAGMITYLAYWLKSSEARSAGVAERELLDALKDRIWMVSPHESEIPEVVSELTERTGLIYQSGVTESGERTYSIVQDSFGEYLAARWCVRRASGPGDLLDRILQLVAAGRFTSGWRYCIELYARGRDRHEPTSDKVSLFKALHAAAAAYRGPGEDRVAQILPLVLRET